MHLGIQLSEIEDIKDAIQRRYISLRITHKRDGVITKTKSKMAIAYVDEMLDKAEKHYEDIKNIVENCTNKDPLAKKVIRVMSSIKEYQQKIIKLCK